MAVATALLSTDIGVLKIYVYVLSRGVFVMGGISLGGICPGCICHGGICHGGICLGFFVREGGGCPGGVCPDTSSYIDHFGFGFNTAFTN